MHSPSCDISWVTENPHLFFFSFFYFSFVRTRILRLKTVLIASVSKDMFLKGNRVIKYCICGGKNLQTKPLLKKGLVVGIILLFIGVAVAPSINSSIVKASKAFLTQKEREALNPKPVLLELRNFK
jgi:hypothetical protein